jgi:hypothetical protein
VWGEMGALYTPVHDALSKRRAHRTRALLTAPNGQRANQSHLTMEVGGASGGGGSMPMLRRIAREVLGGAITLVACGGGARHALPSPTHLFVKKHNRAKDSC